MRTGGGGWAGLGRRESCLEFRCEEWRLYDRIQRWRLWFIKGNWDFLGGIFDG